MHDLQTKKFPNRHRKGTIAPNHNPRQRLYLSAGDAWFLLCQYCSWFLLRSCFWTSTTIFFLISAIKKIYIGTSLVVQWLRLCTSTAGGAGLIPGQGTVIPSAVHCGQKKKKSTFLFIFSMHPNFWAWVLPAEVAAYITHGLESGYHGPSVWSTHLLMPETLLCQAPFLAPDTAVSKFLQSKSSWNLHPIEGRMKSRCWTFWVMFLVLKKNSAQ